MKRNATIALLVACTFASADAAAASPTARAPSERKSQATVAQLQKRIAKGDPASAAFWRDVKRLEALGPPEVSIAVVRHPAGTVVYSYRNVNGLAVADGDIVLGPYGLVQARQAAARGEGTGGAALAVVNRDRATWWPNGIVPFEVADDLEPEARLAIEDAVSDYRNFTPVRFRPRDGEAQFVRFVKQLHAFGLASMTDSVGANGGENKVKLATQGDDDEVLPRGVIARSARHEIGHALGMYHEHNRRNRDDFVRFDHDCSSWNLIYELTGNFSIERESKAIGPYDFDSIMHYPSQAGTKGPADAPVACFNMVKRASRRDPGDATGEILPSVFLSADDVNAMHHMYGRNGVEGVTGDRYGAVLLVHNFDTHPGRDVYPDLAVGVPGRGDDDGAVFLYKGTASGFVLWKIVTPESREAGQQFGAALAAGDFDGDGIQDLAVGAPRATVGGKEAAGKVFVFRIRGNRDVEPTEVITAADADHVVEVMDRFGQALAAGLFLDPVLEPSRAVRAQLAIGAPGARDGARGRTGRVWIRNGDAAPALRAVRAPQAARFGQFGFALVNARDRSRGGVAGRDRLLAAAPGVTLGGCGTPVVYPLRVTQNTLETSNPVMPADLPAAAFCPQDPNLSDATDSFPDPVWDATFGARLASGDFDGDGRSDLAVAAPDGVYVYARNEAGQWMQRTRVRPGDFGDAASETAFAAAMDAGDLDADGRDELVVGAPLAPAGTVPRVGRLYVYRGCRPALIDRAAPPGSAPRPPLRPGLRLCTTLVPWFRLHQTDFQSPSLTTPAAPITGIPGTPLFPPFTENVTDDRVGAAVAVVPAAAGTRASVLAGAPGKALGRRNDAGAVFRFLPSLTPDQPPFRNQTALTSDFTTRVDRD